MTDPLWQRPSVLLTGDYQTSEFDEAVTWLNDRAKVIFRSDMAAAARYLESAAADPLLLVIAQSYPDQFSAGQVEQLHQRAPLSRLAALLGSWCEGEYRSGRPWPGVIRLYWHQFRSRVARWLDCASWPCDVFLPRTSTIAEQLNDYVSSEERMRNEGLIVVRTKRFSDFDALAESLRQVGFGAVWLRDLLWQDVRGATAVIWDGGHCNWSQETHLDEVSNLSRIAPVIALLDFPRQEDVRLVRRAGAAGIASRPFVIDELLIQINRLKPIASSVRDVA